MRVNPSIMIRLLLVLGLVSLDQAAVASSRLPLVQSVDIQIPFAPRSVTIAGQRHLAYELHVTNFRTFDVVLNRVEVLDAARGERIAEFTGSHLAGILGRVGAHMKDDQRRIVPAGGRTLVYLWLPLANSRTTPATLQPICASEVRHSRRRTLPLYSANGASNSKSTAEGRLYPGTKRSPKSRAKLS